MDLIADIKDVVFFQDFLAFLRYLERQPISKTVKGNISRKDIVSLADTMKCIKDRIAEYSKYDWKIVGEWQLKDIDKIKKMQLRRRFKRLPLDIKIELKAKYGRSPVCLKADIFNLSAVGAFIFGCDKFKLQDIVLLKMKLPPKDEELELEAKVVWLADKQVQPHAHPGIGVEFCNLSSPAQQKLLEFIERNLSFMSSE